MVVGANIVSRIDSDRGTEIGGDSWALTALGRAHDSDDDSEDDNDDDDNSDVGRTKSWFVIAGNS